MYGKKTQKAIKYIWAAISIVIIVSMVIIYSFPAGF